MLWLAARHDHSIENFLVFATGGVAYGGLDHSINSAGFNGVTFFGSNSDTAIGWTAGGDMNPC